jgi:hypothetical protein
VGLIHFPNLCFCFYKINELGKDPSRLPLAHMLQVRHFPGDRDGRYFLRESQKNSSKNSGWKSSLSNALPNSVLTKTHLHWLIVSVLFTTTKMAVVSVISSSGGNKMHPIAGLGVLCCQGRLAGGIKLCFYLKWISSWLDLCCLWYILSVLNTTCFPWLCFPQALRTEPYTVD